MPGPSNLYGVANPVPSSVICGPGAQIACPAGTETTLINAPALAAPSSGYFYPALWLNLDVLLGATAPANIAIAYKIGAGSDVTVAYLGAPAFYVNNWMLVSTNLLGPPSNTTWAGAGSIITITANPNAQPVSIIVAPSLIALFRAPDQ